MLHVGIYMYVGVVHKSSFRESQQFRNMQNNYTCTHINPSEITGYMVDLWCNCMTCGCRRAYASDKDSGRYRHWGLAQPQWCALIGGDPCGLGDHALPDRQVGGRGTDVQGTCTVHVYIIIHVHIIYMYTVQCLPTTSANKLFIAVSLKLP